MLIPGFSSVKRIGAFTPPGQDASLSQVSFPASLVLILQLSRLKQTELSALLKDTMLVAVAGARTRVFASRDRSLATNPPTPPLVDQPGIEPGTSSLTAMKHDR